MERKTMKAAVLRAAGDMRVERIDLPEIPDYAVLCRNIYGSTCTATDRHIIDRVFMEKAPLPAVPGHESVGRIVKTGPKVRYLSPGQRILRTVLLSTEKMNSLWGGYAEYGLAFDWRAMREDGLAEKEWKQWLRCEPVPDDISDETAPMLITWRETHSFLTRMGVKPGMRVLVIGSGGTALSFMQGARWEGASVAAVGSPNRAETARQCGAEPFISYRDPECAQKIGEAARGGFDLLIDSVGNERQTNMALPFVKKGGVVGVYGINEPVRLPEGDYVRYDNSYLEGETHERVVEGVRAGVYRAELFYDMKRPYGLDQIGEAFAMLERREWPKALIRLQND